MSQRALEVANTGGPTLDQFAGSPNHPLGMMAAHEGRRMIGGEPCSCCSPCSCFSYCRTRGTSSERAELLYFYRRMRGEKVVTGVENLVGATGRVTTTLAPSGQIRVLGETWEAQASGAVPVGETVRVVAVHGLKLDVEHVPHGASKLA